MMYDRLMMLCIATTCPQPGHKDLLPDTKFAPLKNIVLTVDLLPTEKKWVTHAVIHEVEWP